MEAVAILVIICVLLLVLGIYTDTYKLFNGSNTSKSIYRTNSVSYRSIKKPKAKK